MNHEFTDEEVLEIIEALNKLIEFASLNSVAGYGHDEINAADDILDKLKRRRQTRYQKQQLLKRRERAAKKSR